MAVSNDERTLALILQIRDQFTATIQKAEAKLDSFQKQQKKQWDAFGAATERAGKLFETYFSAQKIAQFMAGAVRSVGEFTASVVEHAKEIDRLGRTYGLSAQKVQEMQYVAEQTGVEFGGLAKAQRDLAKNLEAYSRGKGEAVVYFQSLGVSAADAGRMLRDPSRAFDELGRKVAAIEEPGKRTATAMKLFGEAGAEIMAVFAGDELELARQRFEDLDLAMSQRQIDDARELGKAFDDCKDALYRLGVEAVSPAMKDLASFLRLMADLAADGTFRNIAGSIYNAASYVVPGLGLARRAANYVRGELNPERAQLGPRALELQRGGGGLNLVDVESAEFNEQWAYQSELDKAEERRRGDIEKQAAEGDKFYQVSTRRKPAGRRSFLSEETDRLDRELAEVEAQERDRETEERLRAIDEARQYGMTRLQLLEEQHAAELELVRGDAEAKRAIDRKYLNDRRALEAAEWRKRFSGTVSFLGTMNQVTAAFLGENHKVAKSFALAEALVNTYAGVTEALRFYPPPKSWLLAAQTLAMGMQQVNAIRATGPGSSGAGGGIAGGGGAGGDVEPTAPVSDRPVAPVQNRILDLTLTGNTILGEREYIRTRLAPEIVAAVRDRVDFGLEVRVSGRRG